jgi:hypothetical protein
LKTSNPEAILKNSVAKVKVANAKVGKDVERWERNLSMRLSNPRTRLAIVNRLCRYLRFSQYVVSSHGVGRLVGAWYANVGGIITSA